MAKTTRKPENQSASDRSAPRRGDNAPTATLDRELVAIRAYELYLARGGGEGQELDDWLSAERELSGEESPQTPASARGAGPAGRGDEDSSGFGRDEERGSADDE